MNKWLARLLGLIIIIVFGLFFFDKWFSPTIPVALTPPATTPPIAAEQTQQTSTEQSSNTPQASIRLTSLQDTEDHTSPPILTNPQSQINNTASGKIEKSTLQLTSLDNQTSTVSPPQLNNTATKKVTTNSNSAPAWIQAGSFGQKDNADQLSNTLRNHKIKTEIETAIVNGRKYYRVYVGPIPAYQVDTTLETLSQLGVNARQVTR